MSFPVARRNGIATVTVGPELTRRSGSELRQTVADEMDRGGRRFLLDFSQTGFVDSAGLGALISMSNLVHAGDGTLTLRGLNDELLRLFELTKLDTLFDIVDAPASADTGTASARDEPASREQRSRPH